MGLSRLVSVVLLITAAIHESVTDTEERVKSSRTEVIQIFNASDFYPDPRVLRRNLTFTVLLTYKEADNQNDCVMPKVMPALELAIRDVQRLGFPGVNFDVTLISRDSFCSSTYGAIGFFEIYSRWRDINAVFGLSCDYVLAPISRYSGVWEIPVLSTAGRSISFDVKEGQYPTLTRLMGGLTAVGYAIRGMLEGFNWTRAALMYSNTDAKTLGNSICFFCLSAVHSKLGPVSVYQVGFEETTSRANMTMELRKIGRYSRIVIICADPKSIRQILLTAEELNMIDSGEYVFINIELFSRVPRVLSQPWFDKNDTDENNERARKAYTALLTVTPKQPDNEEYIRVSNEIKSIAAAKYNYTFRDNEPLSTFVTSFYDGVLLYANALNESIREDPSVLTRPINGTDMVRRMWNRSFPGITGNVTIDSNGDRISAYSLLDMNPVTGAFEIVAHFMYNRLEYVEGKVIHWAADRLEPPPDKPECGYDGSLCPDNSLPGYAILSTVLGFLVLIMVIFFVLGYRHYKSEAEINSMTWKVSIDDVTWHEMGGRSLRGSFHSLVKQSSQMTLMSEDMGSLCGDRQIFIPLGTYKQCRVAVKRIDARNVNLNRSLMLELKRMKDLQHDHLVKFYGACLDPAKSFLLTEYCPKGSLRDILEDDEQYQLDLMFKMSLMHDIVRGMRFLHNSDIKSHGNLKSSNCVVDSRFVLKITDFGLHSLRMKPVEDDVENCNSYAYWSNLLWTAPELLRLENKPPEGTQKGDVYSFGIIVHEITTRQGPFYLGKTADKSPQVSGKTAPSDRDIIFGNARTLLKQAYGWENSRIQWLLDLEHRQEMRRARAQLCDEDYVDICCFPFSGNMLMWNKIIQLVKNSNDLSKPFRPQIADDKHEDMNNLMIRCWAEEPSERPDFSTLKTTIQKINKENEKGSIVDNLLKRMEQYANNLEELVEERTNDYNEEKKKCEKLLYQLLPQSVAAQLIRGEPVIAETFDQVTIYFSDIVGFTAISAESTPMQVVQFLNDLYTCFDSIVENFDVYKVETIGDAYMVVSGLPIRNGNQHAREIARLALALLEAVHNFKIHHRPDDRLKLRIGLHTGPCVAGVVGLKMPRYCLFGDTVNTASRMESNGEALKIHISHKTKTSLDEFGTFMTRERGYVNMKGKGDMLTYWLEGEELPDEGCIDITSKNHLLNSISNIPPPYTMSRVSSSTKLNGRGVLDSLKTDEQNSLIGFTHFDGIDVDAVSCDRVSTLQHNGECSDLALADMSNPKALKSKNTNHRQNSPRRELFHASLYSPTPHSNFNMARRNSTKTAQDIARAAESSKRYNHHNSSRNNSKSNLNLIKSSSSNSSLNFNNIVKANNVKNLKIICNSNEMDSIKGSGAGVTQPLLTKINS